MERRYDEYRISLQLLYLLVITKPFINVFWFLLPFLSHCSKKASVATHQIIILCSWNDPEMCQRKASSKLSPVITKIQWNGNVYWHFSEKERNRLTPLSVISSIMAKHQGLLLWELFVLLRVLICAYPVCKVGSSSCNSQGYSKIS